MKKTFTIILIVFVVVLAIVGYYVYNVRHTQNAVQNHNKTYETYHGQEILGTTLISIINKAIDDNEKNAVEKQEGTIYYEDNGKNSIQITIQFKQSNEPKHMEEIAQKQSESFVQVFATASFKCTKIEYHEKTNYVKSLYFEQTQD